MKKYFSSALCCGGFTTMLSGVYKKNPTCQVIFAVSGTDFERAVFFKRLIHNFKGYNMTVFNPFFDESADGIFIENINTYIISDSGYSRLNPLLFGMWEKPFLVTQNKEIPIALRREMLILKACESNCYKDACQMLKKAGVVKNRLFNEISPYFNDEKALTFIHRLCGKHLKGGKSRKSSERVLLTSPTPLGIHTHYDTIFEGCETVISLYDPAGFVGTVLLGAIKGYGLCEKIPFALSPAYYGNDLANALIFPEHSLAITVNDDNHILPFVPQKRLTVSRFLTDDGILQSTEIKALKSVENSFLDKCVRSLFEGRDYRFKYNALCRGFENEAEAIESADKLTSRLIV